jgi:hypothetical protein
MSLQVLEHVSLSLALGHGVDLPGQAARARAGWLPGRQGRAPVLLVALLWARQCPDVVRVLDEYLDTLFADYACTPEGWSETQAARQVLAATNLRLFRLRQEGLAVPELSAGLLLIQAGEVHFLQVGEVGVLRYQHGALRSLAGRAVLGLGLQAELSLMLHLLPVAEGDVLLLAPQPLLDVGDLNGFSEGCLEPAAVGLTQLLAPWLNAPGAAAIVLPGALASPPPTPAPTWPALPQARPGQDVDGWTLLDECPYGPPGRLFRASAGEREALLWLAERDADEAFWQREWVLRRSPLTSLPQVLPSPSPRRHAYWLFELPAAGMRSLADWSATQGRPGMDVLLALLEQLIAAVRVLQRRGMQGLWLSPRQILVDAEGRLLLLPERAAILPGVARQSMPSQLMPLAPELRGGGSADSRADQFALAALVYWLLCGQWPEMARPEARKGSRYVPPGQFGAAAPAGWDEVLAQALSFNPDRRFDALSEFQAALEQAGQAPPPEPTLVQRLARGWHGMGKRAS